MLSSYAVRADVRSDQKTKIEFPGMFGRVVKIFGGKGAREGVDDVAAFDQRYFDKLYGPMLAGVLKIVTNVTAADVAIPAGFKESK